MSLAGFFGEAEASGRPASRLQRQTAWAERSPCFGSPVPARRSSVMRDYWPCRRYWLFARTSIFAKFGNTTRRWSDDAELLADLFEGLQREIDLRVGERGAGLDAQPRGAFRHHGIAEAGDEDAFGQQGLAHFDGKGGVADDDRHDRALAIERLEAARLEAIAQLARDLMKPGHALRLDVEDVDRFAGAGCDGRGQCVRVLLC